MNEWKITGIEEYLNNIVSIYNRWEVKVYEKQGYDNTWKGKSNTGFVDENTSLPEGVYFLYLNLEMVKHTEDMKIRIYMMINRKKIC